MSDNKTGNTGSGVSSARPGLRKLIIFGGGTLVLLVALYFVLTSGAFLKGFVLPRVGRAIHADLTVGEVSLSPFSQLDLRQLKVTTTGSTPLLQADEVMVRYQLFALLTGKIAVNEIRVVGPQVNLIQQADGKSNLDPLLAGQTAAPPKPPGAPPPQVDLGKVSLTGGSLRYTKLGKDGSSQTSEITNLDVALDRLSNGGSSKVTLSADVAQEQKVTNQTDRLQTKLSGEFNLTLDAALQPQIVKGDLKLNVAAGAGAFKDLTGVNATVACDVTTNQVKQLALQVGKDGKVLGQIRLNGPFNQKTLEGRLTLEMAGIDRNLLNLAGASLGMDFADTRLDGSTVLDLSRRGKLVGVNGQFKATNFSFRRAGQAIPVLNLALDCQTTANLDEKTAIVQRFSVTAKQGAADLASAVLDKPLSLAWGDTQRKLTVSNIHVAVTNLNLADWQAFMGTNPITGQLTATSDMVCQEDGNKISGTLNASLTNLTVRFGAYQLDHAGVQLRMPWSFTDYHSAQIDSFTAQVNERDAPLVSISGSANYDLTQGTSFQLNASAALPTLLRKAALPGLTASAGRFSLNLVTTLKGSQTTVTSTVNLNDFTGAFPPYQFRNYQAKLEGTCDLVDRTLNFRGVSASAARGSDSKGSVDLMGKYDLDKQTGDFSLNINNLNQSTLEPFVTPFLAPLALASVSISGSGSLHYQTAGQSSLQLQTEVRQLQVVDPQKRAPATPMNFKFGLQVAQQGLSFDLQNAELDLPPTSLATNTITLQGKIDLSPTNAAPGQLALKAGALDLTPLYDLFATNRPATTATTTNAPAAAGHWPDTEPAAIRLPLRQFTADAQIGRLYLRQVAITNWVATLRLSNDVVTLQPFSLTLNGVPVSADLTADLRQPGYIYSFDFKADNVPLAPLVSLGNLSTTVQARGDISAEAAIQGAGITGPNLQKNLRGQFNTGSTNLSVSVDAVKNPMLKTVVNTVVGLPDLIKNPTTAVEGLLAKLTPGQSSTTGTNTDWYDQLTQPPITTLLINGTAGNGQVNLSQATVQSSAFRANAAGTVTLAPVLTNSTIQIPVSVWLGRQFADKLGLTASDASADTNYVKLPDFLTMQGTVGNPKSQINHTALLSLVAKTGAGLFKNTGNATVDTATKALDALGSLVGGKSAATNAPAATTNAPAKVNPLDLLNSLLPKK